MVTRLLCYQSCAAARLASAAAAASAAAFALAASTACASASTESKVTGMEGVMLDLMKMLLMYPAHSIDTCVKCDGGDVGYFGGAGHLVTAL